jgi:hypothetical protein
LFFVFNFVAIALLMYSREDVSLANSVLSTKSLVEASADTIGTHPSKPGILIILLYFKISVFYSDWI